MTSLSTTWKSDRLHRLLRSVVVVAIGIFFSRILGVGRDIVFASIWGTTPAMAAYIIAFTAPNLLRSFFAEGAFSAGFVPVFTERIQNHGLPSAWSGATRVFSVLFVVVTAVSIVIGGVAFVLSTFVLSGDGLAGQTCELIYRMIPYAVFICLSGALTCALTSVSRFRVPGFSPVLLNITLIITALLVSPLWGDTPMARIRCLTLGVLLAGSLQLGLHLIACGLNGLRLHFRPSFRSADVRRVGILMVPALFGAAALQLNVAADRLLAGALGSMATTSLYYSQRLAYLPIGIFGVALTMVCLPSLSRAFTREDPDGMRTTLTFGLRQALFLSMPVAAFLAVLQGPIIRLLFEHGIFTAAGTAQTKWALSFFLPGIPAFVCAKVATAPHHARQDTKTPVKITAACLLLNIVLNVVLMQFLAQGGLALASSLSSYMNVGLLLWFLRPSGGMLRISDLAPAVTKIVIAAAIATAVTYGTSIVLSPMTTADTIPTQLTRVFIPLICGGITYAGVAFALGCREIRELAASLRGSSSD